MSEKILVTGANGHIGQACIRNLLANGYEVRASIRNLSDPKKMLYLKKLDVEIVEAELFDEESLRKACSGCDGVFQLAAVYDFCTNITEDIIIDTSTQGAHNLIKAAAKTNIKRIILTSSAVAIGVTKRGQKPLTEKVWNTDFSVPYFKAKTEGERLARKIANENGVEIVTVCPAIVIGPFFNKNTPSINYIEAYAKGALFFGAPDIELAMVDVRDVAEVHRLAYEKGEPEGRYLAVEGSHSMRSIVNLMNEIDNVIKRPLMTMPDFMRPMIPFFDNLNAKILGHPRTISKELETSMRGCDLIFDDSMTRTSLNWQPQFSLHKSLSDTLKTLQDNGRL